MARLAYYGYNEALQAVEQMDDAMRERIQRALEMAGAQLAESLRQETSVFKHPTGELASKIKPGPVQMTRMESYVEVWAHGQYKGLRGKPRRAETVAFVKERGRGGRAIMPADPWITRGREKATPIINSIMREIVGGEG